MSASKSTPDQSETNAGPFVASSEFINSYLAIVLSLSFGAPLFVRSYIQLSQGQISVGLGFGLTAVALVGICGWKFAASIPRDWQFIRS